MVGCGTCKNYLILCVTISITWYVATYVASTNIKPKVIPQWWAAATGAEHQPYFENTNHERDCRWRKNWTAFWRVSEAYRPHQLERQDSSETRSTPAASERPPEAVTDLAEQLDNMTEEDLKSGMQRVLWSFFLMVWSSIFCLFNPCLGASAVASIWQNAQFLGGVNRV